VKPYVGHPIHDLRTTARPDGMYVELAVDPVLKASPLGMQRLRWTLASILSASNIWEGSDGWDLRVVAQGALSEIGWSVNGLNDAVKAYAEGGHWIHTVRLSRTRDMVVNVVVNPKLPGSGLYARRLTPYHAETVEERRPALGIFTAEIAEEKVYDGLLMRLFVPEIGMSITLEEFSSDIRRLMTSELVVADGS